MKKLTWPMVVLAGLAMAALVGIFALIPRDDPETRSALLAILSTCVGAVIQYFLSKRIGEVKEEVREVKEQVNGRMSALIEAKTITGEVNEDGVVSQPGPDAVPCRCQREVA